MPIDFANLDTLGSQIVDAVLGSEGGYVNIAADRGGPTNWGITQSTLINYASLAGTSDIKALTREGAIKIYLQRFWIEDHCEDIAAAGFPRLAYAIMDWAVNSGEYWPMESLQTGLNLLNNNQARWPDIGADGMFGAYTLKTLQAAQKALPDIEALMLEWINASRVVMVGHLGKTNPSQETFMLGWLRRITSVDKATTQA